MRGSPRGALVARYALLIALALIVLFPIYLTVVNALLTPGRLGTRPPALAPANPQWHNFADAWNGGHLARYLGNRHDVQRWHRRQPRLIELRRPSPDYSAIRLRG